MITNGIITIYHKGFDEVKREEIWTKYNYTAWWYGGKGAGINKGYDNANDVDIRIPYEKNKNLSVKNISIGDILVKGSLDINIDVQQDLKNYDIYNVTSINDNNFGSRPHIHLGGK